MRKMRRELDAAQLASPHLPSQRNFVASVKSRERPGFAALLEPDSDPVPWTGRPLAVVVPPLGRLLETAGPDAAPRRAGVALFAGIVQLGDGPAGQDDGPA